ncbi:MAG: metallophosphoesterase, partial [Paludibacteraceae bacterium]|nr:metallophosphoesterase [Paludibacteraceae bacterium]
MHAALDRMPRLQYLTDSLRRVYPDLLLLSAGDQQTGNLYNDRATDFPSPVTALMNRLQFDASTLGNHEFDRGLARLTGEMSAASFPYLVCNVSAEETPDSLTAAFLEQCYPRLLRRSYYGYRIALIGLTQRGTTGKPDTNPQAVAGLRFAPWEESLALVPWKRLRAKNDLVILLSHAGFDIDTLIARKYGRELDLIVGGHTHYNLPEGWQRDSSCLVVQNNDGLRHVTLVVFEKAAGGGWTHTLQQFEPDKFPADSAFARRVADFCRDTVLSHRVACLEAPIEGRRRLGELECR